MSRLNRTLSRSIAKRIPLAGNRCFQNCYWALRQVPGKAMLVIGTARLWNREVRHAWIESGKSIIDPSWVGLLGKDDCPEYLAAHRYTKAHVKKLQILVFGRVHREPLFPEWYQLKSKE